MADQRGRDSPPIFYLPTQLAAYKYHALLMLPVWVAVAPLADLDITLQNQREFTGDFTVQRPRGIYGFRTIEERDKFCRRCNAAADMEDAICIPVTVPNVLPGDDLTTIIRFTDTGPVSHSTKGTTK